MQEQYELPTKFCGALPAVWQKIMSKDSWTDITELKAQKVEKVPHKSRMLYVLLLVDMVYLGSTGDSGGRFYSKCGHLVNMRNAANGGGHEPKYFYDNIKEHKQIADFACLTIEEDIEDYKALEVFESLAIIILGLFQTVNQKLKKQHEVARSVRRYKGESPK